MAHAMPIWPGSSRSLQPRHRSGKSGCPTSRKALLRLARWSPPAAAASPPANPPELGTVERAMKRVRDGRYVLIPAGPNTHGHFSHFYAELWKPYLIEFMKSLGPPLAAAAD